MKNNKLQYMLILINKNYDISLVFRLEVIFFTMKITKYSIKLICPQKC